MTKSGHDLFYSQAGLQTELNDTNPPIIINFKQNQENIPTKRSLFRLCKIYMNSFFFQYRGVVRLLEELTRQPLLF